MTKLEQMREVFARLDGSGLSMKAFAAREGILDLPGAPGIASLMLLPPAECGRPVPIPHHPASRNFGAISRALALACSIVSNASHAHQMRRVPVPVALMQACLGSHAQRALAPCIHSLAVPDSGPRWVRWARECVRSPAHLFPATLPPLADWPGPKGLPDCACCRDSPWLPCPQAHSLEGGVLWPARVRFTWPVRPGCS